MKILYTFIIFSFSHFFITQKNFTLKINTIFDPLSQQAYNKHYCVKKSILEQQLINEERKKKSRKF